MNKYIYRNQIIYAPDRWTATVIGDVIRRHQHEHR